LEDLFRQYWVKVTELREHGRAVTNYGPCRTYTEAKRLEAPLRRQGLTEIYLKLRNRRTWPDV
jgi:hypothetical protein